MTGHRPAVLDMGCGKGGDMLKWKKVRNGQCCWWWQLGEQTLSSARSVSVVIGAPWGSLSLYTTHCGEMLEEDRGQHS